jgi:hypothetical protein
MVIQVSRDGPMEVVDQSTAASKDQPNGFHTRILYDFHAHKMYTQVLSDAAVPCSVMNYTPTEAPLEFDLVAGAADFMQQLTLKTKRHPKHVGNETIRGIETRIFELAAPPPDKGKSRIWLSNQRHIPLKWVYIAPDGRQQTLIEVKQLNFAPPSTSNFVPPQACVPLQGEASGAYEEILPAPPGAEGHGGPNTSENSAKFLDAVYPPDAPSASSCSVSFKVARAGAMELITSGFRLGILTSADFSGGRYMVDVTDQIHNGIFHIDKPPKHFYLDVKFGDMDATALIYTRCLAPQMELFLVLKAGTNEPDHWYWLVPGK